MNTVLTLANIESAINYWRMRSPSSGEELALCAQAAALAEPYATMIYEGLREISPECLSQRAMQAYAAWENATHAA